jgi:class 3 adenylate cyclase
MEIIVGESGATCGYGGDAVRATLAGPDSADRALAAARAAIRYASETFEPACRQYLAGRERGWLRMRRDRLPFQVSAGIDSGEIVPTHMTDSNGSTTELQATSIDVAAKICGIVKPGAIGITMETYRRLRPVLLETDRRRRHNVKIGGEYTPILVVRPSHK